MDNLAEKVVGFVGTGVMGRSMAANLMKAGITVCVYNRTREKAEDLIADGAIWKDTPGEVAKASDIVITMVGYPKDVEEVYFNANGLLANAQEGAYLIDMTTSSPALAKKIYQTAKDQGIFAMDAPVSGGDIGAREGTLSIMVGADKDAFEEMRPLFELLGKNIQHQGGAGAGQYTKMANQIAIAGNMMGVSEAIAYAKQVGLDPTHVLDSIATGAAGSWSLSNLAPRMIRGDFAPGFYIKHFIKDMGIAIESAEEAGLTLPGLTLAKQLYNQLAREGLEDEGTQALFKLVCRVKE
ncbi:MAG: NAD(P)-dependent oxidoreductase [Selenomonadales bacterium]|jgi:3-hydroxyisobutyrate dehydrogenase|nr:NAD(P)-dependent oxidoreductase [Selenomonadales bacterium]MBQ2245556.1 NAD(P)-dependent oxidoreductase [Selenomonadales bacterium]MBR0325888.1 NAD(P)-dependent oxidoreductase [Selenomonadales bacterium]